MRQKEFINPAQREGVQHGAYIFPLKKYRTNLDSLHPAVPAHWHEESEFTLIRSGSCRYHMNLDDEEVDSGDILFIPPLMLHSATLPPTEQGKEVSMESDTFVFHLNFLGGNSADICSIRYLTPLQNQELSLPSLIRQDHPAYEEVLAIFHRIDTVYETEVPGYELEIKSLLLNLFFTLLQYQPGHSDSLVSAPPANVEKIRTVLSYMEENYANPMTVEELAALCYFSKYHFMRFFKQHVGMTCMEYMINLRLEKAVELFERGNSSILDVSLSVGFSNLSYFHRAFLKKYHITPKTFLNLQHQSSSFT